MPTFPQRNSNFLMLPQLLKINFSLSCKNYLVENQLTPYAVLRYTREIFPCPKDIRSTS